MPRVRPLEYEEVGPEMQAEYDKQIAKNGRMTNMKRTLAHSPAAFRALMEWYPLHDEVKAFLGERATLVYVHAISSQTDCLICSTFFRRMLIERGEDPNQLSLDEKEAALVEFGQQIVKDANEVSDELFDRLASFFDERRIVTLTTFGAMMIATNIFNNSLAVPLDEYLFPYRKTSASVK